jgi:hypothetical protein
MTTDFVCTAFYQDVDLRAAFDPLHVYQANYNGVMILFMLFGYVFWPIDGIWRALLYPLDPKGHSWLLFYDQGQGNYMDGRYIPLTESERATCVAKHLGFVTIGTTFLACYAFSCWLTFVTMRWVLPKLTPNTKPETDEENKIPLLRPEENHEHHDERDFVGFLQFIGGIINIVSWLVR